MKNIVRREVAELAKAALRQCVQEMKIISEGESCDHSVGICWCGYYAVMEAADSAIKAIDEALK